jgi:hypothetical protein
LLATVHFKFITFIFKVVDFVLTLSNIPFMVKFKVTRGGSRISS